MSITGFVERFGEWALDRLPVWLIRIGAALVALIVLMQVGIWQGRKLEREEAATEIEGLRQGITSLEAEVNRLTLEATISQIIECESGGRP